MKGTNKLATPVLRFPKFNNSWRTSSIQELVDNSIIGKPLDGNHGNIHPISSDFVDKGIPFVMASDIKGGEIDFTNCKKISKQQADTLQKGFSVTNDVLLTHKASVGFTAIVPDLLTDYIMLTPQVTYYRVLNYKEFDNKFLLHSFNTSSFQKLLKILAGGGTRPYIGITSQRKLHVSYPLQKEQQKIASFLSSVDTKIEQLGKKKALWEQTKKGMMQKLFSQTLRFKDEQGNDFPNWEEKRLGDFYEFKSTNSFSRGKLNYVNGEVYNIHYGDIHTKFKPKFDLKQEDVPFINSDADLVKISDDKYCQQGDLVIADASEDYDDIGKTIELISLNDEKVLAGLHTLLARLTSRDIHIGYGAFVMACATVRKQIKIIAQGSKVLGISAGRMEKIKLPIPDKQEQQKIANFLSAIDQKIDLIASELEKAQTFKKGLLQQMFV